MKRKNPLYFAISLVLALILSISVYVYLNSLEKTEETVTTYTQLVAKQEIPKYTKITAEMVSSAQVLDKPDPAGLTYTTAEDFVGKYASERILAGEPFYKSRVLDTVDGNLVLSLEKGNRAVSVMANLESGVAKLLNPGDYIDILVSLPEIKELNVIIRPDVSKLFLQRIQILAIDKTTVSGPASAEDLAAQAEAAAPNEASESVFYLTLSIPAVHLEKLALAESIGRLKFALRPKDDDTVYPTDGTLWQELLDRAIATGTVSSAGSPKTPAKEAPATNTSSSQTNKPVETKAPTETKTTTGTSTKKNDSPTYTIYIVKPGDTLMNIARTELGDASQYKMLQEFNQLTHPEILRPGDRIKIPVKK